MPVRIALLGSTGSIGTQTLDIVSRHPEKFSVEMLAAGSNVSLLARQARLFHPRKVVISNTSLFNSLKDDLSGSGIEILAGVEALEQAVASSEADIVVAAIVGYSGLRSTVTAIKSGKKIALANKETLVVAGEIIKSLAAKYNSEIIPVDSEHSAIFQCLAGEDVSSVEKITLTASGGPFLRMPLEKLRHAGPADALRHPNWNMGDKVTIDSASMMNKGLEVIEARWLFNLNPEQIKVIIHPQSIIHSFVHFTDGSVKAQLGLPDMRLPILYALSYPGRTLSEIPRLDLLKYPEFTFIEPDILRFRNLALAYEALRRGGNMPCVLNAANEVAVNAFLSKKTGFLEMTDIVEYALEKIQYLSAPDLETLEMTDRAARESAEEYIKKHFE
ncbi:MAG: 1-deoxy-D-xylulose-5-phosphate reductoisomerase [Bacteroidales bacterium]|nr:1-deoxy-D-xylulose-5-phosphate reductoisomerase [Bacteroidales bacterium]MBN2632261.1 1-deoxy-D-xylulose-5-phosphate reductoisomerase [Bacteroidales bacterium]